MGHLRLTLALVYCWLMSCSPSSVASPLAPTRLVSSILWSCRCAARFLWALLLCASIHPSIPIQYDKQSHRSLLGSSTDRNNNNAYNSSPLSASASSDGSGSSHQQHQRFNPFLTSPTASTSRSGPSGPSAAFLRVNDPSLRDDVDDAVRMRSGQAEFVSGVVRSGVAIQKREH